MMRFSELCRRIDRQCIQTSVTSDPAVHSISLDSRTVAPGALFVALPGTKDDGGHYVTDALGRGAAAVIGERPGNLPEGTPFAVVRDAHLALAELASAFYGLSDIQSRGEMQAIGVTGTNGKSTTAYMVRALLNAAGLKTALFGTIEYDLVCRRAPAPLTTPDAVTLTRHLVEAHAAGARHAVMEVSSHSLTQSRTAGIRFSTAVFTNLTQDHLDYHRDLDDYLAAKRRLFESLGTQATAVINADDPAAGRMVEGCRGRVLRFGVESRQGETQLTAEIRSETREGTAFRLGYQGDRLELFTPLVGRHNVSNALAAIGAGLALGIPEEAIQGGLANLKNVPGRLQRLDTGDRGFDIYVDYAHTDDALRRVLRAVRPLTTGTLWCVFGCGGDRDRTKRPRMARAVADEADCFVITSDNPRTEDPLAIIQNILAGLTSDERRVAVTLPNRAEAIQCAVERLVPGDALIIAGKGHEDYQILGDKRIHFDDAEAAAQALQQRPVEAA